MRECAPRRAVKAFWCTLVCLPRQVVSPRCSEFSSSKSTSLSIWTGRRSKRQSKEQACKAPSASTVGQCGQLVHHRMVRSEDWLSIFDAKNTTFYRFDELIFSRGEERLDN